MPSGRSVEGGDPRTPMAWQHRDLNYHQSGYQDRYGPGAEGGRPSSSSDRLSHRTDKSWQQHPPPTSPYSQGGQQYPPKDYLQTRDYPPSQGGRDYPHSNRDYPSSSRDYPHSRDMSPSDHFASPTVHQQQHLQQQQQYQSRPQESRHSATATSTISSSSSEEDSEQPVGPPGPIMGPHPAYGYAGYYPGYAPSQIGGPGHAASMGYPYGTMKSAKSVPALLAATYDGEPCPVHHGGMPLGPPMSMPPMMHPGYATMGHPRRAASIYDMRMMSPPPPPTIYGTLPHPMPVPADNRSVVGSTIMGPAAPGAPLGIPPQLLPPMARPRPLVIGEGGTPEVLPVRGSHEKGAGLPKSILASKAAAGATAEEDKIKKPFCWRGGMCVGWIILGVIVIGILLTLMLLFIL